MFVGVDGCKNGWIIVELTDDDNWKVDIFPDIASLWNECKRASLILIDIPIGLRDSGCDERHCDKKPGKCLAQSELLAYSRRLAGKPWMLAATNKPARSMKE